MYMYNTYISALTTLEKAAFMLLRSFFFTIVKSARETENGQNGCEKGAGLCGSERSCGLALEKKGDFKDGEETVDKSTCTYITRRREMG